MENWDEAKLKEVVEKKHGENERKMPKTDIVSSFSFFSIYFECIFLFSPHPLIILKKTFYSLLS